MFFLFQQINFKRHSYTFIDKYRQLIDLLGIDMKIGSVEFYKKLILTTLALLIIIPIILCVILAAKNYSLQNEINILKESLVTREKNLIASTSMGEFVYVSNEHTIDSIEYTIDYQKLFPDLFWDKEIEFKQDIPGSTFLTFDDGPSALTPKILRVLREKNIKATFFVVYNDSPEAEAILRDISEDGHTIGVHSSSHVYSDIYKSVEAYLEDFEKTAKWIEEVTGSKPEIFRFPGGSINSYNQHIYKRLIAELLRRGFVYYDWNVSSGDASYSYTADSILKNVLGGMPDTDKAIILMHDSANKNATLKALPEIIDQLKSSGRILLPLDRSVKPIFFGYKE